MRAVAVLVSTFALLIAQAHAQPAPPEPDAAAPDEKTVPEEKARPDVEPTQAPIVPAPETVVPSGQAAEPPPPQNYPTPPTRLRRSFGMRVVRADAGSDVRRRRALS